MKVLVVADSHMFRTPDGKTWCQGITGRDFFSRYTQVFEEVSVACRVQDVDSVDTTKYLRVDDDRIHVFAMPFARGTKEYLMQIGAFLKAAKEASGDCDCAIFRVPSVLSFIVHMAYKRTGKPYSIEVVADPDKAYTGAARVLFTAALKKMAKEANGASYVTRRFLQEKYPNTAGLSGETKQYFESYYSSIDLYPDFLGEPKKYPGDKRSFVITHTANKSASFVKGQDVLMRAVGRVVAKGWDVSIRFIGDTEIHDQYDAIAREAGISDRVTFTGMLSGKDLIRKNLIESDLFVLPTKAEGLPRSIIEAMAVGLPCISAPVDGVPELLKPEYLVEQSDDAALADKIVSLLSNPMELERMSAENLENAKEYLHDNLVLRRNEFYGKLYRLSE